MSKLVKIMSMSAVFAMTAVVSAFADEGASAAVTSGATKWYAISAGLAIAIAAFGGAMGQGRAISSALEGIARNPGAASKVQTPMIIGLALIESLVLYALIVAFFLIQKIA